MIEKLSSSARLIRAITSAHDKQKALDKALGAPGSKKRRGLPKSLRKKVHEEVNPQHVSKTTLLTPEDIRFREALRQIKIRDSISSLENEKKAIRFLDERIKSALGGRLFNVKAEYRTLKEIFNGLGTDIDTILMERYENLVYYNSEQECNEKVVYAKLLLCSNKTFSHHSFSPYDTDAIEVKNLLDPLNNTQKRMFIESVLFDPSMKEEDVEPFIVALKATVKNKELQAVLFSVGGSLLDQVFELAAFRIGSRQDYGMSDLAHFEAGITTRQIDPERYGIEGDDEDTDEDFWEDHEWYEDTRQEILMSFVEEGLLAPTLTDFEKLYEAAIYESIRHRVLRQMVTQSGKSLNKDSVLKFFKTQAESRIAEPDHDIYRRLNVARELAGLKTFESTTTIADYLNHNDIYLVIEACRSLARKDLFGEDGVNLLASRIRKGIKRGDFRLIGIVTLNSANPDDNISRNAKELLGKVFSYHDIDMVFVYLAMDGLSLPFSKEGYIRNDSYPKSTYDFISSISLHQVSEWIRKPKTPFQRTNAMRLFNVFPSEDKEIFLATSEGELLLKSLGMNRRSFP